MTSTITTPYWIDYDYDQDKASNGVSRYGAYVRQASDAISEALDRAWNSPRGERERFAVIAWRQATGPVMVPGYVREHPRIQGTRLDVSEWDGYTLLATVNITTPQPPHLRYLKTDAIRPANQDDDWWHDWPSGTVWGGGIQWQQPSDQEATDHPYLVTTTQLRFPIPGRKVPFPAAVSLADSSRYGGAREAAAHRSVEVLVSLLNQVVGPALDSIAPDRDRE